MRKPPTSWSASAEPRPKRVIAIFDRTNVFAPGDRPKLVALHPVPDPR